MLSIHILDVPYNCIEHTPYLVLLYPTIALTSPSFSHNHLYQAIEAQALFEHFAYSYGLVDSWN